MTYTDPHDVTEEVITAIMQAAEEDEGPGVRATLRRAGYLWECPHCAFDTIKPGEDDIECEECGVSSKGVQPSWQVTLRHPFTPKEITDPTPYRGYGDRVEEATHAAKVLAGSRYRQTMEATVRAVAYSDTGQRIGYYEAGTQGGAETFEAFATKSPEDEIGYSLGVFPTKALAAQAVTEEFDQLGPYV